MRDISQLIGNTPMVELKNHKGIFVKLEYLNPFGSVKDRIAYFMIKGAFVEKLLKEGDVIVEPTSGNTGIALASLGKLFNIKVILTMPSHMSKERVQLMKSLGAEVILTEESLGMDGAIKKAKELIDSGIAKLMLNQFENPFNPIAHELTTGPEILRDMNFDIDAIVLGIGTGGTITGVGRSVKKILKNVKIFGVEPFESPVISKGVKGKHTIEGIGAGFIPKILDLSVIDEVITIKSSDARTFAQTLIKEESILGGVSAAANVLASISVKEKYGFKRVVTVAPDRSERYISEGLL